MSKCMEVLCFFKLEIIWKYKINKINMAKKNIQISIKVCTELCVN